MGCKARRCIRNPKLHYAGYSPYRVWNDFKKCNKKEYEDGFCKLCFNEDKRTVANNGIDDQRWKRDGIYGEPYDFPYHIKENEKKWVAMIYHLHPSINPNKESEESIVYDVSNYKKNEKIILDIKNWLETNSEKLDYKMGSELNKLLLGESFQS
jgi:hypothetical protein